MTRLHSVQLILIIIGLGAVVGCISFGMQKTPRALEYLYMDRTTFAAAPNYDAGFDGAAIGLGFIAGVCFLCCVWIEIVRFKAKNER